jgi:hypothetical protein
VPLIRDSAGGLLLKQRNARGDRVIHAQEFFRHCDLPEDAEPRTLRAQWSRDRAALVVRLADTASSRDVGTSSNLTSPCEITAPVSRLRAESRR